VLLWPAGAIAQSIALPPIEVIATTPLPGAGIDRDKVPAMVQTLTAEDFRAPIVRTSPTRCSSASPA
jgi:hypothetical protein